jgi:prepilin peptidase CpaA
MMSLPLLFLGILLLTAAVIDIRSHRIPNWLTFSVAVLAVLYHTGTKGFEGFLFSIEGVGVGIAVLIIPYLIGGVGAGDAKLMGAVGGLLGPEGVFMAFLFTALIGGIYALVLLAFNGILKETAKRYGAILKTFIFTQKFIYVSPSEKEKRPKLCYGIAIALGTTLSVAFSIKNW